MDRLAASYLVDDSDHTRLTSLEIQRGWGCGKPGAVLPAVNEGYTDTDEDDDYMCYDDDDCRPGDYVGAYENFMLSYGLKPWDDDDCEEALAISRALKDDGDEEEDDRSPEVNGSPGVDDEYSDDDDDGEEEDDIGPEVNESPEVGDHSDQNKEEYSDGDEEEDERNSEVNESFDADDENKECSDGDDDGEDEGGSEVSESLDGDEEDEEEEYSDDED